MADQITDRIDPVDPIDRMDRMASEMPELDDFRLPESLQTLQSMSPPSKSGFTPVLLQDRKRRHTLPFRDPLAAKTDPKHMIAELRTPPMPPIGSGSVYPELLPNEVILHELGTCLSKFEASGWLATLKRRAQLECRQCSLLAELHPTLIMQSEECVGSEEDIEHVRNRTQKGKLYLTSERLVFVPRAQGSAGYSFDVQQIDMLKIVCDRLERPYLLCYVGEYVASVPCSRAPTAMSIMSMISNVRFEQHLRHHLAPEYAPNEPPTYANSEESISRFLGIDTSVGPAERPEDPATAQSPSAQRGQKFTEMVKAIGLGAKSLHVAGHNGYKVGHEAHRIVYR